MKLTSLLAVFCLFAGCATPNIPETFSLGATSGTGVAAGSITYEGGYAAYRLHLVATESRKTYIIEHGSSQTLNLVLAFKGEQPHPTLGMKGSPFAVALPAGNYQLRSWHISQGAANVRSTEPANIEFTVQPGQAIYIGNYHFKETARLARAVTGATVTLSDFAQRDVPALQVAFPMLKSNPLTQSLSPGTTIEAMGGRSEGRVTIPVFVPITR